jgi:hypothetical protein
LVDPEIVAKYMLGSQQVSDWQKGSSIIWRKDFNGRRFEDKGRNTGDHSPKKSEVHTLLAGLRQTGCAGELPDRFGCPERERQREQPLNYVQIITPVKRKRK